MAGIGKLARLLVKGRQILRSPAMKKVGNGAKKAGNALIWPFKKAHDLQSYSSHPTTIGGKIKKGVFKTLDYTSTGVLGGSFLGMVGGVGTTAYATYKEDSKLADKGGTFTAKSMDAFAGTIAGLLLGGPIGALAGAALALYSDKSLLSSGVKLIDKKDGQQLENVIKQTKHEMANDVKELLGFSKSEAPQAQEVKKEEEQPEVDEDKRAVEEFCKGLENLEVGQTITVPEIKAAGGSITMQAGDQEVELTPGDKITRTEEGFEITKANAQEDDQKEEVKKQEQIEETQEEQQVEQTQQQEEQTEVQEEQQAKQEEHEPVEEQKQQVEEQQEQVQQQEQQQQQPVEQTPPADNLFGGEINEITKKDVKIEKGDCLWNIAKRELQAVNQGKTITNAQILKQVKEFGRLNPNIKNLDLIYPEDNLKLTA